MVGGSKRGLVAPQNSFLDHVIRRASSADTTFILANAQIVEYPIVYCNEYFSKLTGYSRAEIMQKSCSLSFMYSEEHSDAAAIQKIQNALTNAKTEQTEIGLCKKNKQMIYLLVHIAPIKNDQDHVVLYLCQFKDITPLRQPLTDENSKGLSRILQIARIAKSKQQFNQIDTKDLSKSHKNITSASSNFNQLLSLGSDMMLPQYSQETPKTSPNIVLHYSTFKNLWDWGILSLTFYTAFMVPFNIAFKSRDHRNQINRTIDHVAMMDSIVDVIFFADILLNFSTTYVDDSGQVVIEPSLIRRNYLTSWFLIDLLSCLPYDIFYMFKNEDEGKGTLFSTLKVVRLLRLGRVARKLDNYLEYGAATLLLLLCAYVLVAHWMACLWYTIGEIELKFRMQDINYPDNWLVKLGNDLKQPYIFNNTVPLINGTFKQITDKFKLIGGPDRQTCYLSALYFAVSSVSTVGYGNVSGTTDLEKLFAVVMMLTGSLMYAAIFGHMTTIIQQMTSSTARYHEIISNVREFIKLQEIPRELSERIMDYISWSSAKGIDTGKVLGYCPKDMKSDICVHLNRKIFKEHGCFALASDGCLRSFALSLESIHIAPGNLLYHTGESVDALWFVAQGSLEIIQDEEVVAILGKGDVFGDEFWKGTYIGQSTANVRALTYTDLHMIKKEHLMEILNFYKSFGNSFSRSLTLTYNLTHRLRFRKMVDVLREKELDERRKHEKFTLAEDHPVRKLLQRIKERHATKIIPLNEVDSKKEAGITKSSLNSRGGSLKSVATSSHDDEMHGSDSHVKDNSFTHDILTRAPSVGTTRRRSPFLKGKTFDDGFLDGKSPQALTRARLRTSSPNVSQQSATQLNEVNERLNVLTHGMQNIQENSTEARANFERLQHQVSNIERLLTQFFNSRQGGIATPSTRAMGSYSALPGDGSPYNERASESWTFFPSTQATQLGSGGMMQQSSISPNIPPLRHLSVDNPSSPVSGEEDDIATNMVPLIFIDQASTPGSSSTSRNTSAPPLNRSGPHHPQFHRP